MAKIHREMKASKSIETNIIVSGLPESGGGTEEEKAEHDKASVEELLRGRAEYRSGQLEEPQANQNKEQREAESNAHRIPRSHMCATGAEQC